MFSTPSWRPCLGASMSPAASSRRPASRTGIVCVISSRKCGAPTVTSNIPDGPSRAIGYTARPLQKPVSMDDSIADFHAYPDSAGHFGRYGGRFVAETLIGPLQELAAAYDAARIDPAFVRAYDEDLAHYVGRPSPIYFAERLSRE